MPKPRFLNVKCCHSKGFAKHVCMAVDKFKGFVNIFKPHAKHSNKSFWLYTWLYVHLSVL